ncbi:MAG: hypothetical protein JXQ96_06955 [Cyclobacteriaceae bacterium]
MLKQFSCLLIGFVIGMSTGAFGQRGQFDLGARANAMGNASVTLADGWSMFNNIGGLARVENTMAFFTYQNKYGIPEFKTMGGGFAKPLLNGVAGVGVFRFGGDFYNEQKINLGFSNQFGFTSLGLNVNYLQYNIEGQGSKGMVMLDFGGLATITEQLVFGAQITNINQAELSSFSGEKVPTVMTAGLSYRPSEGLMLNAEVEKDLDFDAYFKIGLEYEVIEKLTIRTGLVTEPFESAFGIGFAPSAFDADYAFRNNPNLGDIHELSITYRFKD